MFQSSGSRPIEGWNRNVLHVEDVADIAQTVDQVDKPIVIHLTAGLDEIDDNWQVVDGISNPLIQNGFQLVATVQTELRLLSLVLVREVNQWNTPETWNEDFGQWLRRRILPEGSPFPPL
jgi:hypothetical protein